MKEKILPESLFLWPEEKVPLRKYRSRTERRIPDAAPITLITGVNYPSLVPYRAESKKGPSPAVIVCPGGAYDVLAVDYEGYEIAEYLSKHGISAFVLKYRVPKQREAALCDALRAVRYLRYHAEKFGIRKDSIGIMGFSAGGHLTLMTATNAKTPAYAPIDEIDRQPCTVQWACPIYPAYALTDGVDSPNAQGGNEDDSVPVPEFSFDDATPPMCFVHGDADVWAAMNSVKIWELLRRKGIQCDLHTLATRGHCFQFSASPDTGSYTWMDRIWEFLNHKKFNK